MANLIVFLPSLVLMALAAWFGVRVLHKAGYPGWWVVALFVPILNIVMLWVFAFAEWPALAKVRGAGRGGRFQNDPIAAGGTIVDRAHRPEAHPGEPAGRERPDDRWMFSGFDGEGHAVRLAFSARDAETEEGLLLGRSPRESDLILADPSVSRRHARLLVRDGRLFIEDAGSSNGTRVDGRRLSAGEAAEIVEGTEIELGETRLLLSQA